MLLLVGVLLLSVTGKSAADSVVVATQTGASRSKHRSNKLPAKARRAGTDDADADADGEDSEEEEDAWGARWYAALVVALSVTILPCAR